MQAMGESSGGFPFPCPPLPHQEKEREHQRAVHRQLTGTAKRHSKLMETALQVPIVLLIVALLLVIVLAVLWLLSTPVLLSVFISTSVVLCTAVLCVFVATARLFSVYPTSSDERESLPARPSIRPAPNKGGDGKRVGCSPAHEGQE